jgi:hypothetical protein
MTAGQYLRSGSRRDSIAAALAAWLVVALLPPSGADAASVVNGGYESGDFSGWQSLSVGTPANNHWYVYSGTSAPLNGAPIPAPPEGSFAAITGTSNVGTHILYQDVSLEAGMTHQLSFFVYYNSQAPIASPESLDEGVFPNQQYRIDVMRPSADLESVSPTDVLMPLLRTLTGSPQTLIPTPLTADLTPLAGQTIRLRFALVTNQHNFNAGTDAVAINTLNNRFSFGKLKRNLSKGTATLSVDVPGPGALALRGKGLKPQRSTGGTALASKDVDAAGKVKLTIRARGAKKAKLNRIGKVRVKARVTFTPTGGLSASQSRQIRLKKRL